MDLIGIRGFAASPSVSTDAASRVVHNDIGVRWIWGSVYGICVLPPARWIVGVGHGHDYKAETTSWMSEKSGEAKSSICVFRRTS